MTDLRLTDRPLARADAVEEIPHMIVADVEVELLGFERLINQFGAARFKLPARHVNPTLRAREFDPVQQLTRLRLARGRAKDGMGRRTDAAVADTALVRVDDFILARRRV